MTTIPKMRQWFIIDSVHIVSYLHLSIKHGRIMFCLYCRYIFLFMETKCNKNAKHIHVYSICQCCWCLCYHWNWIHWFFFLSNHYRLKNELQGQLGIPNSSLFSLVLRCSHLSMKNHKIICSFWRKLLLQWSYHFD